jgi:eukaryotic-like serine/threonine-protein kinase
MAEQEHQADWTSLVLIKRFRAGDELAAEAIFSRYFERLSLLARSKLAPRVARRTDPEDVALSTYRSFFVGVRNGRFVLSRGGDLWRLLASIAKHKLLRQTRRERAGRRSVDRESPIDQVDEQQFLSRTHEPGPDEAVAFSDLLESVLARLDSLGRRVLELRLQGAQLSEIAHDTGRSERTIRRSLGRIRELLAQEEREDSRGTSRPEARFRELGSVNQGSGDERLLSHRDFLLKRMIGSGRMGKVYLAWQHSKHRMVAVKFLRKSFLGQFPVVQRFIGEARTIAKLRHRGIVGVHGLGRTPAGAYFIVMDLVTGPNLAQVARSRSISTAEAIRWCVEICQAVEYAHAHAIVHCDLKPANVLLDDGGSVRVTDFGFARSLTERTPWTAEIEGTAPFMAPEQASSLWGDIGIHTDVYGIGAVLYALLTGRPPWTGARLPDILADVISAGAVTRPIQLCPEIPRPLSDLCAKCLAKPIDERYLAVRDLRLALSAIPLGLEALDCTLRGGAAPDAAE